MMATTARGKNNNTLPNDVLILILSCLSSPKEFATSELVCKSWKEASQARVVWEERISRLFEGKILSRKLKSLPHDCKETFAFALKDSKRDQPEKMNELCDHLW